MSQVLHDIEKKIIKTLQKYPKLSEEKLTELTKLTPDQIRRGIEWLKLKNIADIEETSKVILRLGKNGVSAKIRGLPERRLLELLLAGKTNVSEIQKQLKADFAPAMGIARKNNWIKTEKGKISILNVPSIIPEETILEQIGNDGILLEKIENKNALDSLRKRPDFIVEKVLSSKNISLTDFGKNLDLSKESKAIDVQADVPEIYIARKHPLKDIIDEIREIFVTLGFTEILGNLTQSSFWNFDALFTPQDHPAREMQDTFFLENILAKKIASSQQIRNVAKFHKKFWRYPWNVTESRKMVLRTHTTCITIKYLSENKSKNARLFSLGRVFRNEKVSYKHLVEFHQVEGVVTGKNTTLRDLMGIQTEFYKRIGLTKIKFWPTFFPYTEPSLQTMVYNDKLKKWIELFGMGIFRPEVTKPLGIKEPVLAWGGGIERIAMLKYNIDDVREFYSNNLNWLRNTTKCQ